MFTSVSWHMWVCKGTQCSSHYHVIIMWLYVPAADTSGGSHVGRRCCHAFVGLLPVWLSRQPWLVCHSGGPGEVSPTASISATCMGAIITCAYCANECVVASGSWCIPCPLRAPVFARRSDLTARRLKMQTLPLLKPHSTEPWTVNGVFRLTGVKTLKGKWGNQCPTVPSQSTTHLN